MEVGAVPSELEVVVGAGVVKCGAACHTEADFAPHRLDAPHELMCGTDRLNRHKIGNFGNSFFRKKAGQENRGVRQVELPVPCILKNGGDSEVPTLVMIQ